MNTRLQVEHPVTELVTGIDLVEAQLRVATGEPLGIAQEDVAATGHALEVRLYAEDVPAGFLPATGPVLRFVRPAPRADVRIDSGIEDGSDVSRFYDPMLAKLVVHGADRGESIDRMTWLLERTSVLGVTTNVDFLRACVDHAAFRSGDITTGFIDEHLADWAPVGTTDELLVAAAVALQASRESDPGGSGDGDIHSPWRTLGPWRTGQVGGWRLTLEEPDRTHQLQVTGRGGCYRVTLPGGHTVSADVRRGPDADGALELQVDGREVPAVVRSHRAPGADRTEVWAHVRGVTRRLVLVPPTRHADPGLAGAGSAFTSPMPGAVSTVAVSEGDHVPAGTTLMVVEAMKMEHPIKAPVAGTVTALHVRAGDPVDGGAPLLAFEPDAEEEHP